MKTIWFWLITVIFAASLFALNIADETTFLNTLIVERRSSTPTAATTTRGRIYFDDVAKSYHGDTGTKIVEILTDTLAAHNILDTLHKDTTVATIVRGDLLIVDSIPKWTRFAKGVANAILRVDAAGDDLKYLTPGNIDQVLGFGGTDLEYKTISGVTNEIDITPTSGDIKVGFHKTFQGGSGISVSVSDHSVLIEADRGWTLIQSFSTTAQTEVDFIELDNTYDLYAVVLTSVLPTTDGDDFRIRVFQGNVIQTGSTDYEYNFVDLASGTAGITNGGNSTGNNFIQVTNGSGSVTGEGLSGIIYFSDPAGSVSQKFWWSGTYIDNTGTPSVNSLLGGGAYNANTNPITGVRLYFSTSTIAGGNFALYGLVK